MTPYSALFPDKTAINTFPTVSEQSNAPFRRLKSAPLCKHFLFNAITASI